MGKKMKPPKTNTPKLFLFADMSDRTGSVIVKRAFEATLLTRADAVAPTEQACDQFMDALVDEKVNHDILSVIGVYLNPNNKYKEAFAKNKRFGGLEEEFAFGVGTTKDDARKAYTEALPQDEDDDHWVGE